MPEVTVTGYRYNWLVRLYILYIEIKENIDLHNLKSTAELTDLEQFIFNEFESNYSVACEVFTKEVVDKVLDKTYKVSITFDDPNDYDHAFFVFKENGVVMQVPRFNFVGAISK